ncbi:MAG: hypothetical protein RBU21_10240 [FCB group bacterium]|jgi:hypothetical protein|nr:hypothetical protein [FCB group bacterium]
MRFSEFEIHRGMRLLAARLNEIRRASPGLFEITQDFRPDVPLASVRVISGTGQIREVMVDPLRLLDLAGVRRPPVDGFDIDGDYV